jgi:hypothetical protein
VDVGSGAGACCASSGVAKRHTTRMRDINLRMNPPVTVLIQV